MFEMKTAVLCAALALAACGGGGNGSGTGQIVATATDSALVGTVVASTSKNAPETPKSEPPPCSVAFWGDSISALIGPYMPAGLTITAHPVWGGTAQAALSDFLQDPLGQRFIVIEYGTNDANGASPFEEPMRSMLDRAKALGRTVVLTGMPRATKGNGLHAVYDATTRQLAAEYGATYADWPAVQWEPADTMPDGVHPADAYQKRLADSLATSILNKAPECRQ